MINLNNINKVKPISKREYYKTLEIIRKYSFINIKKNEKIKNKKLNI